MYCTSFDWPPSATIPWSSCSSKVCTSCSVTSLAPIVCTMWKQFIETFYRSLLENSIRDCGSNLYVGMRLVKRNCLHISYGSKYICTYNVCTLEKGLNPPAICAYVCQGPGIHRSTNCVMQPTITSTYSLHIQKKSFRT